MLCILFSFQKNIEIYVNRLNSKETVIPYEYDKWVFCFLTQF